MYCNKCGASNDINNQYCENCGCKLISTKNDITVSNVDSQVITKKIKSIKNFKKTISIVFVFCLAIFAGVKIYVHNVQQSDKCLASVQNQDGKYGYINALGEETIPCIYDLAFDFEQDGYALVFKEMDGEYKGGIIDYRGNEIIACQYEGLDTFSENGLAPVGNMNGWGFIDKSGESVIPMQYVYAKKFASNGFAPVKKVIEDNSDSGYGWGYIDESGKEVITCQYVNAGVFSEHGIAAVQKNVGKDEDGNFIYKWGFINEAGEEIIPFEFEDIVEGFGENGLAVVQRKMGKDEEGNPIYRWGFISVSGSEEIPFRYTDVNRRGFSESGYIAVTEESIYGETTMSIINENGQSLLSVSDYSYEPLEEPYIENTDLVPRSAYEGKVMYLKNESQRAFEEAYDYGNYFAANGMASVGVKRDEADDMKGYKCSYINKIGTVVLELPDKYQYASTFRQVQ